jgi:APA family basic amino acid/polyamine antiporter
MKSESSPRLVRGFGLLPATALNMSNMVGVGPFISIPILLAAMNGPQAMLGWVLGALLAACDGLVWSELGAALPGSGGSYHFLRETYGPQTFGRLMAFLFIWQFVLSGPLEIASGMIGFSDYAGYLWPAMTPLEVKFVAAGVGLLALALLYRRITVLSRLTVTLWVGTILTMVAILAVGLPHCNFRLAFSFPPHAFSFSSGFLLGLGSATLVAMYNYLGYYDVCYIGDEVREPARVIPRSILLSVAACALAYGAINVVLIGVVPWRQAIHSQFIVSEFVARLYGRPAAIAVTVMILWTAFGSVFALLLGYSRIPYAAAVDGNFFRPFARLHPTKNFPHISLLTVAGIAIAASFFRLDVVIDALITTRVLVQFIGQIFALPLLRRRLSAARRPYKMWLYPLPAVVALLGWTAVFLASGSRYVLFGLVTLVAGAVVFLFRARWTRTWPFLPRGELPAAGAS